MTVLGYNLSYLELIGSIFSLASVILATRAKIWTWPIGIIGQIFLFLFFLSDKLYGNMGLQVFFTIVAIYGWYFWDQDDGKKIQRLSFQQILIISVYVILCCFILTDILKQFNSEYAFLDATTTVLSVFGVFLLSRKYLESWIIWISVDILSIVLFYLKGMNLISIEYVLITFIATYGFINWIKMYGTQQNMG